MFDNEIDALVSELDFGDSPGDMLVIREVIGARIAGIVIGLSVGVPVSWAAWTVAVNYNDVPSGILFAAFAIVPLAGSVWLFGQLLNSNCYYVALDDQRFYRRWGPRKLVNLPLQELGEFTEKDGEVLVEHLPTNKSLVVIKNSYAPERVTTLASRLNAWRAAPRKRRSALMGRLHVFEARDARTAANRQILIALSLVCLFPLQIVVSVKFGVFGGVTIFLWGIYTLAAFFSLVGGIVKRLTVPRLKPAREGGAVIDSEPEIQAAP